MAYNNYFPMGYYQQYPQQTFYQPQMPPQQQSMGQLNQQQPSNNAIIWVNNETEAQNYPVAPNNAVALWDSSRAAIYLKQADASGRPTFKAFDLVEHRAAVNNTEIRAEDPISRDDLNALKGQIEALMFMLKQEGDQKKKSKSRTEVVDNE